MRILVDTSVWIDFFNDADSKHAHTLARYIDSGEEIATCGVIVAEFFQGLRRSDSVDKLGPYFVEMTWLSPREPDTWMQAAAVYRSLRTRGVTVRSTIDCVIACLAVEHDAVLLAKDREMLCLAAEGGLGLRLAPLLD